MAWVPLTRDRQDETQAELERLLGVTEATFAHSVFAAQGARHYADPEVTPRERKEILAEAVGLDVYDRLLELCRTDLRSATAAVTGLDSQIASWLQEIANLATAEGDLVTIRDRCATLEVHVARLAGELEECEDRHRQARAAAAKRVELETLLGARRAVLEQLESRRARGERAAESVPQLEQDAAALEALAASVDELRARVKQLNSIETAAAQAEARKVQLVGEAAAWRARADEFHEEAWRYAAAAREEEKAVVEIYQTLSECDRCGQLISDTATRETAAASRRRERDRLQSLCDGASQAHMEATRRAEELQAEADAIEIPSAPAVAVVLAAEENLADALGAATKLEWTRGQLEACRQTAAEVATAEFVASLRRAQDAIVETTTEIHELDVPDEEAVRTLWSEVLAGRRELDEARQEQTRAQQALGAGEQRVERLQALRARVQEARGERAGVAERVTVLEELERMYSRDGVPALILEALVIPTLEQHTNEFLERWGLPLRVELRTQRGQKTTDRLRETLDVIVNEPRGARRYETYSGGERARVNVALRVALVRLLAQRSGAPMQVFCLDEVEYLDEAGQERLAELLRELQAEIPVILVVSHAERLRDAWSQTVTVVREGGVSRLEAA